MTRWVWLLIAYISLGVGVIGIAVPGLPTVPFVLLSAYAATRGSEHLRKWLIAHPQFGPMINDWENQRAVSRRAKAKTVPASHSKNCFACTSRSSSLTKHITQHQACRLKCTSAFHLLPLSN